MKKTEKTALTAAVFAAALGAAALAGGQAEALTPAADQTELTLEKFSAVYGPPPDYFMEPTAEAEPTEEPTELPTFQEVYGPPPTETPTEAISEAEMMTAVYGPMPVFGDINHDARVDSFDMTKLRRVVTGEEMPVSYGGVFTEDVNEDGEINIADLVAMGRYLIGQTDSLTSKKIKKNRIKVIYQEESIEPATEEETNPFDILPQPKYGPPYDYDPDDPLYPLDPIDQEPLQPYYGAPSFFGIDDF